VANFSVDGAAPQKRHPKGRSYPIKVLEVFSKAKEERLKRELHEPFP
jgi:hypothetical protein